VATAWEVATDRAEPWLPLAHADTRALAASTAFGCGADGIDGVVVVNRGAGAVDVVATGAVVAVVGVVGNAECDAPQEARVKPVAETKATRSSFDTNFILSRLDTINGADGLNIS
jgi:hypothetical protein